MTDKKMIESLRNYAKAYASDKKYDLNPGLALMIANRMERLVENMVLIEADLKTAMTSDDNCLLCGHYIQCNGKECDCYIEGNEAINENGNRIAFQWSCMDFNWGDCPKMDDLPCKDCDASMNHFVWRGNETK